MPRAQLIGYEILFFSIERLWFLTGWIASSWSCIFSVQHVAYPSRPEALLCQLPSPQPLGISFYPHFLAAIFTKHLLTYHLLICVLASSGAWGHLMVNPLSRSGMGVRLEPDLGLGSALRKPGVRNPGWIWNLLYETCIKVVISMEKLIDIRNWGLKCHWQQPWQYSGKSLLWSLMSTNDFVCTALIM